MDSYISWVQHNPMLSAAVQFAVLGTLGEVLSHVLRSRRLELPFGLVVLVFKVAAWALLGLFVKLGFVGIKGAVAALLSHGFLPEIAGYGIGKAVATSTILNLFFGPQLMVFHRLEDNLIERRWNFAGIGFAFATLIWFWIPAHSVTFALPPSYQIGLAALWSLVLGMILGLAKPK